MIGLQKLSSLSVTTLSKPPVLTSVPNKHFWGWLTFIFNRPSKSRIQKVGADRACAEWLMRNGALIRWKGSSQFLTHYDNLPKDDDTGIYHLHQVNATDSSISHQGFAHFKDCKYLEGIKFDKCHYLEDEALRQLVAVKSSLESLLIFRCGNLTDKGLLSIANLLKLRTLELGELVEVKDLKKSVKELQAALPNCNIKVTLPQS